MGWVHLSEGQKLEILALGQQYLDAGGTADDIVEMLQVMRVDFERGLEIGSDHPRTGAGALIESVLLARGLL